MPDTSQNSGGNQTYSYKILFQIFLWGIWVGYPMINTDYKNPDAVTFLIMLLTVRAVEIPLFYLIVHYLVPKIFRKHGVAYYFVTLLVICLVYIFAEDKIKFLVNPDYQRSYTFFIFFPVMFVAAIGTGYGLVTEFMQEEQNRREERQERMKSELSFLRSQISPHFIFNVLNSIVYLIRRESDLAESVTIKLSELIRYMLYETDNKQVTLDREINYLRNYIDLQKIRYSDDIEIEVDIMECHDSLFIEPMLLIAFVENAFKHGVGIVRDPKIGIKLACENAQLTFQVTNRIGPETHEAKDFSSGIGLKNVRRRLELLYPEKHSLSISDDDGIFSVTLTMKLKRENTLTYVYS
ncbi:histidine kinase [Marinilongibacter aquaticus]|uniref:sensor histidine kinase n=1 Tax=Marinilongibacter aquaticus TaxID=2975157 RepID=UPI0021BD68CA|nr:histidine kinase [Marinilongibacter aquaticus]UBM60852.1 histidine kinase [Marinilongibacter aquaticus]